MTDEPGGAEGAPPIAAFTDLIVGARIRAAADAAGTDTVLSTRPDRIVEAVAAGARIVFIDLDSRGADPLALIARLKDTPASRGARVVAFASHVRTDLIEAARGAGADRVLARGAFARILPRLVRDPLADAG
jgi:CheY-like chemotaxis protein